MMDISPNFPVGRRRVVVVGGGSTNLWMSIRSGYLFRKSADLPYGNGNTVYHASIMARGSRVYWTNDDQ